MRTVLFAGLLVLSSPLSKASAQAPLQMTPVRVEASALAGAEADAICVLALVPQPEAESSCSVELWCGTRRVFRTEQPERCESRGGRWSFAQRIADSSRVRIRIMPRRAYVRISVGAADLRATWVDPEQPEIQEVVASVRSAREQFTRMMRSMSGG